jgi:hypothetical protein
MTLTILKVQGCQNGVNTFILDLSFSLDSLWYFLPAFFTQIWSSPRNENLNNITGPNQKRNYFYIVLTEKFTGPN